MAESGIAIRPHRSLEASPPLDTVIIPGGKALRLHPATNARVAHWLKARAPRIRRVASVCTGIYALAPTGLLDGRRVTTHWRFTSELARLFPKLRLDPDALLACLSPRQFARRFKRAFLAVSGLLNGIFGSDENRHIATWSSVKVNPR